MRKISGRTAGQKNAVLLEAFIQQRESKNDWVDFVSANGERLARSKISLECGFGRSALQQNPAIKARLRHLDATLRERGILRGRADKKLSGCSNTKSDVDRSREITSLEDRLAKLWTNINALNVAMENHEATAQAIADSV